MLRPRVIPILLLSEDGLVKTRRFTDRIYVGDPNNAIRIFNTKEVDELIVLDIDASRLRRGPNLPVIAEFADECFMPLCYGGGISTIDQASAILELGVEKVSLQTSALADLQLVTDIANRFGSQAVVVAVDVVEHRGGSRMRRAVDGASLSEDWESWARRAVDAGAGEVLLTSVDREGTGAGLDLDLITRAASALPVPVVAHGGVGSLAHIREGLAAGASAVAAGSFFVLHGPHRAVLITYLPERDFALLAGAGGEHPG
mgnify:CR=1 FL=1